MVPVVEEHYLSSCALGSCAGQRESTTGVGSYPSLRLSDEGLFVLVIVAPVVCNQSQGRLILLLWVSVCTRVSCHMVGQHLELFLLSFDACPLGARADFGPLPTLGVL